jgi:hypothetical protein
MVKCILSHVTVLFRAGTQSTMGQLGVGLQYFRIFNTVTKNLILAILGMNVLGLVILDLAVSGLAFFSRCHIQETKFVIKISSSFIYYDRWCVGVKGWSSTGYDKHGGANSIGCAPTHLGRPGQIYNSHAKIQLEHGTARRLIFVSAIPRQLA